METTTTMDTLETKVSMPAEWTDEKHSLYLKCMEATFVNQLYASTGFIGRHSQKENSSDLRSSRETQCNTHTLSGQFKVYQGGCWKKIGYEKAELQPNKANGSHDLVANPWIQHFRPGSKHQAVADPTLQESAKSMNSKRKSRGKNVFSCELTTTSKHLHPRQDHWCDQDMEGRENEMSDQNFVGEYIEGEKASSICSPKRTKRMMTDDSNNDQTDSSSESPV